jgi:tetratricopeptide (TPR) repeat protein
MSVIIGSGISPKAKKEVIIFLIAIALIVSPASLSGQGNNKKSRGKQEAEMAGLARSGTGSYEIARTLVLAENFSKALPLYARLLSKDSANVSLNAEYAYVLALDGIYDAALARLDRIWGQRGNSPDVNFYASQVFALMGYDPLATAITGGSFNFPAPEWIASRAPELLQRHGGKYSEEVPAVADDALNSFRKANRLTAQGYYLKSAALFEEITTRYPDEFLPYVGYSIALERAGMLGKSAQSIEKALTAVGDSPDQEETRKMLNARLISVRSRMGTEGRLTSPVASLLAKTNSDSKRLIASAGGMFAQSFISINGRFGIVNKGAGNTSVDLGMTKSGDATSITLGLSNYMRQKVFVAGYGINGSFGGGTSTIYFKLSVGLSFMNSDGSGSWDIFLDGQQPIAPKGAATTVGMSIGRSVYFGKR